MKTSHKLWIENLETAQACYSSAFVQGIKNSNLPINNFKSYIAQDAYFLEAFAKAYAMCITKSNNKRDIKIFSDLLIGVVKELELHESYANKWDVDLTKHTIHNCTKKYSNFLLKTSQNSQICQIISAMIPCMRLYTWIGKKITKDKYHKDNQYKDWIDTYSDISFEKLTIILENVLDSYDENIEMNSIKALYSKAMDLELSFFKAFSIY